MSRLRSLVSCACGLLVTAMAVGFALVSPLMEASLSRGLLAALVLAGAGAWVTTEATLRR